MRFSALHTCWLLLASCNAHAQVPAHEPTASTARTTYFLIDSSASMANGVNWADAVDAVVRRLAAIQRATPNANLSLNQIISDPVQKCGTVVSLAPLAPAQTVTWTQTLPTGSTLLGAGLEKAVHAAGDNAASIVIFTDGSQTCGPDICDVAQTLLPSRPNLNVELVFTENSTPEDKDHLRCVAAAQSRISEPANEPLQAEAAIPDPEPFNPATTLWLVSLTLLVASAVVFSFHYARAAAKVEHKIRMHKFETDDTSGSSQQ